MKLYCRTNPSSDDGLGFVLLVVCHKPRKGFEYAYME